MAKNILLLFFFFALFNCKENIHLKSKGVQKDIVLNQASKNSDSTQHIVISNGVEEEFIDSLNVGIRGKFKVDFKKFRSDSVYVVLKFYEKKNTKWILKQDLIFEKDGIISCDVQLEDFNNDGLNDLTFKSNVAARGANEIRKLLFFDKKKGKLNVIRNSDSYPNLRYNKKLNCIDSQAFYAGSTTYFLKIEKDSLREFASISSLDESLEINLIDKKGNRKLLERHSIDHEDVYIRYSNYKPLEVLEGE